MIHKLNIWVPGYWGTPSFRQHRPTYSTHIITLHCITRHYTTLYCTTLHYISLFRIFIHSRKHTPHTWYLMKMNCSTRCCRRLNPYGVNGNHQWSTFLSGQPVFYDGRSGGCKIRKSWRRATALDSNFHTLFLQSKKSWVFVEVPSLKLIWNLKISGWETIYFWTGLFAGVMLVSGSV